MHELIIKCSKNEGGEYSFLYSLIVRTIQVLQTTQAHSSRTETLQWLYTAVMWYVKGTEVACAYVEHLLVPQVLLFPVSGILHTGCC